MNDDELSDLLDFHSTVSSPREQPDPCHLRDVAKELQAFPHSKLVGEDFARKVRRAVIDGFQRLDALPRSDPFWEGTNRRPTLFKVGEFMAHLLSENPADVRALWTRISRSLVGQGEFLDPPTWRRLHFLGQWDVSWPINTALLVQFESGVSCISDLAELLKQTESCAQARPILQEIARSADPRVARWATRVMECCGNIHL